MKKSFQEKWAALLRSKKYRQEKGALRRGSGFCCLGVACDLIDPSGWPTYADDPTGYPVGWKDVSGGGLELTQHIGLSKDIIITLAQMNDIGASFEAIADVIDTLETDDVGPA